MNSVSAGRQRKSKQLEMFNPSDAAAKNACNLNILQASGGVLESEDAESKGDIRGENVLICCHQVQPITLRNSLCAAMM